jgi:hypothetical protein
MWMTAMLQGCGVLVCSLEMNLVEMLLQFKLSIV